ncbi:MAG: hypothetical protein IJO36_10240 [Clostridia bacterium]|nr:hypothetical protein [Clostridia bacterium]
MRYVKYAFETVMKLFEGSLNEDLYLSLFFLIFFCVFAGVYKIVWKKKKVLKAFHFLFLGAGFSMGSIFWRINSDVVNPIHRFVVSMVATLKSFGFDFTPRVLIEMLYYDERSGMWKQSVDMADMTYVSVVSVFAVIMTAFAALSIFKDTAAQLRYSIGFFRKAHIFSELNEKSICLARDVRKNNPFSRIVFTGVDRVGSNEASEGLVLEAENINAIMTRKSVLDFRFMTKKEPTVYLIDLEESNNIKNGIELYKKHRDHPCTINVFSTLESSESFIDGIKKGKAKINLVNRAQIIAYDILMRYPMYKAADKCDSDTMSVLVIGAGTIGMEFAKAAMWCGVMDKYKFKIRILDSVDRESGFRMRYPYFDDELKRVGIKLDYKFGVVDVNSSEFNQKLEIYGDANYIVVATGDDEQNINVASRVRRFFIKRAIREGEPPEAGRKISITEPFIIPVISNSDYYNILGGSDSDGSLCPYGSHSNIYNSEAVNNWPVDALACRIHTLYREHCIEKDFDYIPGEYEKNSQTDKRSNRANAVHILYKLKDIGVELRRAYDGDDKKKKEKEEKKEAQIISMGYKVLEDRNKLFGYLLENKDILSKTFLNEHNRWCVFELLDGWSSWSVEEVKKTKSSERNKKNNKNEYDHKDKRAMLHAALVSNDMLPDVSLALKQDKSNLVDFDETVTSFIWMKKDGFFESLDGFMEGDSVYKLKIYYHPDMIKLEKDKNADGQ